MEKSIDIEKLNFREVLKELNSDEKVGLSSNEAEKRLEKYGLNIIKEHSITFKERVIKKFWGPIPWMIEIAGVLSAIVQKWEDFFIILIMLLINAFIGLWQEGKALNALEILKEKLAKKALVFRDGKFNLIDASLVVIGDIIKIKMGDIVPADLKLISGNTLRVDQSVLTGESNPVKKGINDLIYANSIIKQGEMIGIVVNTGINTFFGKTVSLVASAEKGQESHFKKAIMKITHYLITLTILLSILILLVSLFRHEPFNEILIFILVMSIASIPVALPAVLSVTMAIGALGLAKKQAIVSRLVAIEELAGVDILCSDKTGTLTLNHISIANPIAYGKFEVDDLIKFATLSSKEENIDPIEVPIFEFCKKLQIDISEYKQIDFTPFDSIAKRSEAIIEFNEESFSVTKGAPQVIMNLSAMSSENRKNIQEKVMELANDGYRSLAVAIKRNDEFEFVGLIPMYDPPRKDSLSTIENAKELGIDVKMITGDNMAIAKQIASLLKIDKEILSSQELNSTHHNDELIKLASIIGKTLFKELAPEADKEKIKEVSERITFAIKEELRGISLPKDYIKRHESEILEIIENAGGFSEVFPEDKFFIVDKLQKANHIVAMTGDGVNDAPALKKADVGIAVSNATDAARASADLILLKSGLSVIIDAIYGAREVFERMRNYSIFRITETIRIIFFMALAIISFNFYPVTPVMIILLALLNDIPILAIAYDNVKTYKYPIRWNIKEILIIATILGLMGVSASFLIFYIAKHIMHLSNELIQTFIFLKLAVAGHLTIYVARTKEAFFKPPYPAKALLITGIGTQIVATLFAIYGWFIAPITLEYALFIWIYSIFWLFLNDFIKIKVYKFLNHS